MANPVAQLRFGSSPLLAATLAAAILGCGGQSPAPSPRAQSLASPSASGAATQAFLSLLDEKQRAAASFPFDDPERVAWSYVPQGRAGIPLQAMNTDQRSAALGLLGTGLGERGTRLARGIIELEGTLRDLEEAAGSPMAARRDPELYYLTLFGRPGTAEPWGWRFEGHHLSVNVTELGPHGQIVAPLFMGANPARVPSGPKKGLRVLAEEEDLAFELLHMLDPRQRARATIGTRTTGDILTRNDPAVGPMAFSGLSAAEMTADQQGALRRLLESYAGRMSDTAAHRQLERIEQAGFGRLHFAWAGAHRSGEPHYYRIHGPTVLIEYDNTQSNANHIHTVWRDLENDFGGDLLRKHYARQPHRR
jgi:hypothetical protein